jgi:hypothetical protein
MSFSPIGIDYFCDECGVMVNHLDYRILHTAWHDQLDKRLENIAAVHF